MEIKYRKLSELKPSPKNPRKVEPGAVEELAKSIKANPHYFEARPILLSDRTGDWVIIAGERRSEAAALLGMDKVPTILMSGLTEEQEDEIMIRDNTHTGVWDAQKLNALKKKWGETVEDWLQNGGGVKSALWKKEKEADIEFTEVLNEEHNYLVLYFDNSVDWLQIVSLLGLESVQARSTRVDGKVTKGNQRIGVGRVLKGPEVLEKLKKIWNNENIG